MPHDARGRVAILLTLSLLAGCPSPDGDDPPAGDDDTGEEPADGTVRVTDAGTLHGFVQDGSVAFLGVPFAAAPVGELRWQLPQPLVPWDGELDATTYAEWCTQTVDDDEERSLREQAIGSEDCLYLNVWTPEDADPEDRLPVIFFVHGGGNIYGGATEPIGSLVHASPGHEDVPLYGGARLAARGGVVVVTTQYRLGAPGYLSHPALDAESPTGTSGNYGLQDLIAALTWVQDNIEVFQGDPGRVLLAGQSGGARDVNALATCDAPDGLFAQAAIHSAPLGLKPLDQIRDQADLLVDEMGCTGDHAQVMACLRAVPAEDLVLAEASVPLGLASGAFIPTVDGHLCTEQPRDVISSGQYAGGPFLLGTTENEYSHRWSDITEEQYPALVVAAVGKQHAAAVLAQYPLDRFESPTVAYTEMMSDKNVTCPHRRYARLAADGGVELYFYRFRELLEPEVAHGYGAYHTSDILFLFQHLDGGEFAVDAGDTATQEAMLRYWTRFADQGDPSGTGDPTWPPFDLTSESFLSLEADPWIDDHLDQDDCDFWDQLAMQRD